MIIGVDHLEFVVADIDAVAEFFVKLGFTEVRRTEHHGEAVEIRVPGPEGIILEFHTGLSTEPPGLNHIAFRVDNTQATVEQFAAAGIVIPDAKIADKSGRSISSFRDPSYNRWQLSE